MARNLGERTENDEILCKTHSAEGENRQNYLENLYGFKRKFAVVNDLNTSYFDVGQGENTLIFLHGWGSDATAFFYTVSKLCAKYRIIALDFAGFGRSDNPPSSYTVADYALDVVTLLDVLGVQKALFVGHSFGTRVAIEIAVFYPKIVQGLVIVDGAGIKPRRKPSYYLKVLAHKILKRLGKKGLKGSSDYSALSEEMKKVFVNVVNYDQKPILNRIACPCAVFWGKQDEETPRYMYECFLKNVKGAQGFLLDGGHFAFVQDRLTFSLILEAYLQEIL